MAPGPRVLFALVPVKSSWCRPCGSEVGRLEEALISIGAETPRKWDVSDSQDDSVRSQLL